MSAPKTAPTPVGEAPVNELTLVRAQVAAARRQVDAGVWVVIVLGLAFTAVNVQQFAAGDAPAWSPPWSVAWLLDPMVSVLLLSIVRAEQVTARWQVSMGWQVTTGKWGCFAATYVMNTWSSWRAGVPSGVVLHSVPPVAVLLAAEAAPTVRDRLTAAAAAATAAHTLPAPLAASLAAPLPPPASTPASRVLLETPSVPAATGTTPPPEGAGREGPDAATSPAGVDSGPSQGPAPDPEPVPPTGSGSGPRPGDAPPPGADPHLASDPNAAPDAGPGAPPDLGSGGDGAASLPPVAGDARVRLLVELLDAGNPVTGQHAAALLTRVGERTSDRTGRRLLAEARQLCDAVRPGDESSAPAAGGPLLGPEPSTRTGTVDAPGLTAIDRGPGLVLLPTSDRGNGGRR